MGRRRKSKRFIFRLKLYAFLIIILVVIWAGATAVSNKVAPLANTIAAVEAKNYINGIIYGTINRTVIQGDIVTSDFYTKTEDEDGMITSLTVNTVLVNAICAEVADLLSEEFRNAGVKTVEIPMGTFTGIDLFASIGPSYRVKVIPRGNAIVDYETKFEAVGINQINFQVWLNVLITMRVSNPLQAEQVLVERKVALVNTVFSGKVPENLISGLQGRVVN